MSSVTPAGGALDAAVVLYPGPRKDSLRRTLAALGPAAYTWEYPLPDTVRTAALVLTPPAATLPTGASTRHGPASAGGLADAVRHAFHYPAAWAAASAVALTRAEDWHVRRSRYWAGYGLCRAGYAGVAVGAVRRRDGVPITAEFPLPRARPVKQKGES